jgi:hypothetical protein
LDKTKEEVDSGDKFWERVIPEKDRQQTLEETKTHQQNQKVSFIFPTFKIYQTFVNPLISFLFVRLL